MIDKFQRFRKTVYSGGILIFLSINQAFALVNFQCYGNNYNSQCIIMKGNSHDARTDYSTNAQEYDPSQVITQDTIDAILKKQKNAKQLTIEFTPGNYTTYPLSIQNVNNLTFKLDNGTVITAIPMKQKNKSDKKDSNPWKNVEHVIEFINCNNLTLVGAAPNANQLKNNRPDENTTMPSVIDGNGADWWKAANKDSKTYRPPFFFLQNINGLNISNLEFRNSPRVHLKIRNAKDTSIDQILIHSDKDSPNTDGINVGAVQNLSITNSTIYNGDDSIAINSYKPYIDQNIKINNMAMYYGHGISLGSDVSSDIENVTATNIDFHFTHNGLRIKTDCDKDCSDKDDNDFANSKNKNPVTINNINFNHITMEGVKFPIIYNFGYESKKWSNVNVKNITYSDIHSENSKMPSTLLCHKQNGCSGINFDNVSIDSAGECQDISITQDGSKKTYSDKATKCLAN